MANAYLNPVLCIDNIDAQIESYAALIEKIGLPAGELKGIPLLTALKRSRTELAPYPRVSLFEAANRIMTDLVLLHGVRWLLRERPFPFSRYTVEFGNGNTNEFDILAEENGLKLIGEAFNVARSFFQVKRGKMRKKLSKNRGTATYSLIMLNTDAVADTYIPTSADDYHIFVDVVSGEARMTPPTTIAFQATDRS